MKNTFPLTKHLMCFCGITLISAITWNACNKERVYALGDKFDDEGFIFYLSEDRKSGLIAALADQSAGAAWGCEGPVVAGADGEEIGSGLQNSLDISAACAESGIAVDICLDYSSPASDKWYLPSIGELKQMYDVLRHSGSFDTGAVYWSSTETNAGSAWTIPFSNGQKSNYAKSNNTIKTRAIRQISL